MPTALVTSGPTLEKIDPVRFISNFSSGKQGHAIAKALHDAGFEVTLISGPVNIPAPDGIKIINVESAEEMLEACVNALPVDVAVCVAAVCDFRPEKLSKNKIKKTNKGKAGTGLEADGSLTLKLIQNPDILKTISNHPQRPKIVVGFAAETENLIDNAKNKLQTKGCDMIIANDVGGGNIFGADSTNVTIISRKSIKNIGSCSKTQVAKELALRISKLL